MSIRTANHHTIRKVITAVGSCFDNLTLITYNKKNEEEKRVRVPIEYAQKEKYIHKLTGDYDNTKKIQIALPRLSYELVNLTYDNSRKLPITGKITNKFDKLYQLNSVPYNFGFEMALYTRNLEDAHQLMETILPYFNADFNIIINDDPEFNFGRAMPIILNSVKTDIDYQGNAESNVRMVTVIFSFTAKAHLYPPTIESKIIREVIVNIKDLDKTHLDIFLKLNQEGVGLFEIGEHVYQGFFESEADAGGIVVDFDEKNMIVQLKSAYGTFMSNMQLKGSKSLSHYDVICGCHHKGPLIGNILPEPHKTWVTVDITPDPLDANYMDDYDYKIKTKEFE